MGKLTLHAKIELGLAMALLLGSCDSEPSYSADEAYDLADVGRANSVNALDEISGLEDRVAKLEERADSDDQTIATLLDSAQSGLQRDGEAADRLVAQAGGAPPRD